MSDSVGEETVVSATTFAEPIVDGLEEVSLNRSVTIYASGSVTVDSALKPSTITISKDDIRAAIGVGSDQFVPALSRASISHL